VRYDAGHKELTRRRVLSEAAAAIRRRGPAGVGVADLMAQAGLTHGGFYVHFESKDELVAEAISAMFDERYRGFRLYVEGKEPAKGLAMFVDRYLSTVHRDGIESGCPLPSLSSDVARLPLAARRRFAAGAERLTQGIANVLRELGKADPRGLAASMLAEMVGALALSRAVADPELSKQILASSREAIKRRMGLDQN
jgi:TetR/AcrR family transcriptional regulator, transcriptional repressor for nem operon